MGTPNAKCIFPWASSSCGVADEFARGRVLDTHRQVVGTMTSFSSCSTSRSPSDALASAVESALRLALDLDCFLRRRLIVSAYRDGVEHQTEDAKI